ncbi:MAG: maltose alpha-D-glucosyltransferase [Lamprobacter sp.]|uniref:maltose alpha-D-glucosyltransferase n=1 Tax=Lamprobacter sp. TaxID=3100796 RepID=UPI002B259784|nr:maltose alpha-D-glucosyltransferase [Lamprobacter sp.]MEA3640566.1 maltose alpha-D-glucosyltransferase [Lamprobacter sp.]
MPDLPDLETVAADPLWYKDAIIYQTHVKAFFDTDGDGTGDFRGLTEKLDYVQALGVNAIWLLPFYPSPMRDDGYDISDYRNVHPAYGSKRDVRRFISAAHRRGIRVIVELIINHTSDQHPWFQAARRAPKGSNKRNFYVWSDDDSRFSETRIIFTDSEASNWTWDPVAEQYYWHRFFSHQPDLNHNNPQVVKAMIRVMRAWLDLGVDGLRLDAIPYLCVRDGTSNENLPETHAVIKQMRAVVDAHYENRMFLAEANQWPEDVRDYFGDSDECHVAYHFPLMPRMYMALAQEDRHPIVEIMEQTPDIPADCQWALFLRNHDELTLEMVSDRERDYMYQTYATDPRMRVNVGIRRRLAPLLDNNPTKIRLMFSLLLSMPGSPILYYGDELGMGDNIYLGDRNAVRTPMQWTPDRNAGFSRADPERLYLPPIMDAVYGYQSVNAEAQSRSASSLLNWMRRIIEVRKAHRVFGRGSIEFLHPGNRKVLAYVRESTATDPIPDDARDKHEILLCVVNLSRGAQPVELDLARFQGRVPIELLGRTPFPPIGELPYLLTLAGHGFYWFLLSDEADAPSWHDERLPAPRLATLVLPEGWKSLSPERAKRPEPARRALRLLEERVLPGYLDNRFQIVLGDELGSLLGGAPLSAVQLSAIEIWRDWLLTLISVELADGTQAQLLLPLWLPWQEDGAELNAAPPAATTLARARRHATPGQLCDALADPRFVHAMIELIGSGARMVLGEGLLSAQPTDAFRRLTADCAGAEVRVPPEDRGHSAALGDQLMLKLLPCAPRTPTSASTSASSEASTAASARISAESAGSAPTGEEATAVEPALDPNIQIRHYLQEFAGFANTPALAGWLSYESDQQQGRCTLAVLEEYIHNQGNLRTFTLELLSRLCDAYGEHIEGWQADAAHLSYETLIDNLGRRLAELHRALAREDAGAAFAPEWIDAEDQATLVASLAEDVGRTLAQLERSRDALPEEARPLATALLAQRADLLRSMSGAGGCDALRIRVHGDLALSRMLVVENDIVFIDFGGDWKHVAKAKPDKQSPLADVARVLRSFHEVADEAVQAVCIDPSSAVQRRPVVDAIVDWRGRICRRFLSAYREALAPTGGALSCPASSPQEAVLTRVLALYGASTRLRDVLARARELEPEGTVDLSAELGAAMRVLSSLAEQEAW